MKKLLNLHEENVNLFFGKFFDLHVNLFVSLREEKLWNLHVEKCKFITEKNYWIYMKNVNIVRETIVKFTQEKF